MASAVYKATITFVDRFVPSKLRPLWNHPAGPKTVFFWSPMFKWVIMILIVTIYYIASAFNSMSDGSRPVIFLAVLT